MTSGSAASPALSSAGPPADLPADAAPASAAAGTPPISPSVSFQPEAAALASQWDVVVIGSGAAGLMTALELPAGLRVLLLSKNSCRPPG